MFPHETRPGHFIWPILYVLIGGGLYVYWPDEESATWMGGLVWAVALIMSLWLMGTSLLNGARNIIEEDIERYKLVMKMSNEDRQHFNLPSAKDSVKLDLRSTETNWSYSWISLDPKRLKMFAFESLNGKPFSVRAWTGRGRLMSEDEFNNLRDDFVGAGCAVPRSDKDDRQGFEWTDKGLKVLGEIAGVNTNE